MLCQVKCLTAPALLGTPSQGVHTKFTASSRRTHGAHLLQGQRQSAENHAAALDLLQKRHDHKEQVSLMLVNQD